MECRIILDLVWGEFSTNSSGSYGISSIDLAPLTNFIGNQVEFRIYFIMVVVCYIILIGQLLTM